MYSRLLEVGPDIQAVVRECCESIPHTGSHDFLRMRRICDKLCRVTPAEIGAMNKMELRTFVSTVVSDLREKRLRSHDSLVCEGSQVLSEVQRDEARR